MGRPPKKLGYVYLDLYRRPWGHTNRDGLLAINGHYMSIGGSTTKKKTLFMILGKSRLVKHPCNSILGAAVGKGDLFNNPFYLGKRCWGALCLRESFVVERSLPKNVSKKVVCICGIIICQAGNGYGLFQISDVIEMHSIYLARSICIFPKQNHSHNPTRPFCGEHLNCIPLTIDTPDEDQLVGSSCTRVSRSCQIMSWPCLPLPGQPNVADVSCGPIFSGKTLEFQGGVVESPNLGVMETVSIVKVYCNFQALLVCLQKTSYWKRPFLEDLPRSASGSLFQRYPEVCS